MKVSLNHIKQYIDFELPPVAELVERINSQLGGVEEIIDLADKYKDAKIVHVVECEKHPNADRLNVTKIDAGTGELVQVVCGAPNVRADMWAVWLPPESIVPATYGDAEPFKLGARELRGVLSHGMLAAADELALGSDHEGILEINPDEWKPGDTVIEPGASFAKVYGLDDTIIDIENKMFTHRPDLFGQLGVAREIAGIFGHQFKSPSWYLDTPVFESGEGLPLDVFNDAGEKVPRFMAVAMKNVAIKPSPVWLQCALVAMGAKPINNIVDVTNYVMLLTAQPTHAYDYDKIRGGTIGARMARAGEKVALLNDKTYELTEDDIVIADAEGPVALGGIMGGGESEVDENTTNIVLEVATFDMYTVRKSSMRHGVFTDALTRFNKGQSPLQNDHIMNLLMMSIKDVSAATQASGVFDEKVFKDWLDEAYFHGKYEPATIEIDSHFINNRLGLMLKDNDICDLLNNVEIHSHSMEEHGGYLCIQNPLWRTDIEQPEDIVEEVGRLYGFDRLPRELPQRSAAPASKNADIAAKQSIREVLARAGGNEVLTYSFVHEKVLVGAGQDPAQAFRLSNALSPDLQYYRLSVLPSLLDKVHMNIKAGHDEFMLYEIGKAHHAAISDDTAIPKEFARVAGVYAAKVADEAAPYYRAKRVVDYVSKLLVPQAQVRYERVDMYDTPTSPELQQLLVSFDPVRSAVVKIDGRFAGVVGEFRPSVAKSFKLPARTAGFELDTTVFAGEKMSNYRPLSRYQTVRRDVSFRVAADMTYEQVLSAVSTEHDGVQISVEPVSIYRPVDSDTKTITLSFVLTPYEATLAGDEAAAIIEAISAQVVTATQAQVV